MIQDLPNKRERKVLRGMAFFILCGMALLSTSLLIMASKKVSAFAAVPAKAPAEAAQSPEIKPVQASSDDRLATQMIVSPAKLQQELDYLRRELFQGAKPEIREAAACGLGIMRRRERSARNIALLEKQVPAALQHAFTQEASPPVRQAIVLSAAEYDGNVAGKLLEVALLDKDAAVREAAILAQVRRQKRMAQIIQEQRIVKDS